VLGMCLHGHSRIPIHIILIVRVLNAKYIKAIEKKKRGLHSTSEATWTLSVSWTSEEGEEDQTSGC
jgi:hypothetical protein